MSPTTVATPQPAPPPRLTALLGATAPMVPSKMGAAVALCALLASSPGRAIRHALTVLLAPIVRTQVPPFAPTVPRDMSPKPVLPNARNASQESMPQTRIRASAARADGTSQVPESSSANLASLALLSTSTTPPTLTVPEPPSAAYAALVTTSPRRTPHTAVSARRTSSVTLPECPSASRARLE